MRGFGILLLVFLWFALCTAYPKKDDRPNEDNAVLLRHRRSITGPISSLVESTADVLSVATTPIQTAAQMVSSVVRFIVEWLIRVPLQIPMNMLVGLMHFVSGIFPAFFSFLPKTIDSMRDYVRDRAVSLLENAIKMLWHFLSTTGLPWMRRVLGQIEKMPNIPEPVKALIKGFNTLYSLAEIMGFVSRA